MKFIILAAILIAHNVCSEVKAPQYEVPSIKIHDSVILDLKINILLKIQ